MENIFVTIIIPAFNAEERIESVLDAIHSSSYSQFECIVVDDNSSDKTVAIAESFPVKIIRLHKQHGPAFARNRGAESAKGDILVFIDSDVLIYPNTIEKIVDTFSESPDISALFGSYDDEPEEPNFYSQYKNLFHHYVHQTSRREASSFWAGCGAIRRTVFHKIGGFNEEFTVSSIEDIELGHRLHQRNFTIHLIKSIQVKHLKHWTFKGLLRSDIFHRALPWTDLMIKSGKIQSDLNLKNNARWSTTILFMLLLILPLCMLWAHAVWLCGLLVIILIHINMDLYSFMKRKRGYAFVLKLIPMHWLYYIYSGLAFGWGTFRHMTNKTFNRT